MKLHKRGTLAVLVGVLATTLVACGGQSSDSNEKKTLTIASDMQYAPFTYLEDGEPVGFDIELGDALGEKLGVAIKWENTKFDSIIPGLQSERYDVALTDAADTVERQKQVDFVDYWNAGKTAYGRADLKPFPKSKDELCGLGLATSSGSWGPEEAEKLSKACEAAGKKPIDIQSYAGQTQVLMALRTKRAVVALTSTSLVEDVMKKNPGVFKMIGETFEPTTIGMAFPKESKWIPRFQEALQELMDDGTYLELLEKYNLADGARTEATINDAAS